MLLDNPKHIPDSVPMPPELPENVFLINSLYEANICLRKLMRMISEASKLKCTVWTFNGQYCIGCSSSFDKRA